MYRERKNKHSSLWTDRKTRWLLYKSYPPPVPSLPSSLVLCGKREGEVGVLDWLVAALAQSGLALKQLRGEVSRNTKHRTLTLHWYSTIYATSVFCIKATLFSQKNWVDSFSIEGAPILEAPLVIFWVIFYAVLFGEWLETCFGEAFWGPTFLSLLVFRTKLNIKFSKTIFYSSKEKWSLHCTPCLIQPVVYHGFVM